MKGRIIKAGIGYTIGNILLQCMGIVTLPIFTRLLTTAEYGQYAIFMSYSAILLIVISCALHSSVRSANITFPGEINQYTSTITIIHIIGLIILVILVIILPPTTLKALGLEQYQWFLLALYSFSTSILTLYNTRISLEYAVKKYIILSGLNTIISLFTSLLLMLSIFNSNRIAGRLIGVTFAIVVVAIMAIIYFYRQARPKIIPRYLHFGLKYSYPLIAHGIAQTLLAQFDRIMINSIVGAAEAGIYGFAGTIKMLLNVINNSLNTVWATWFFDEMSKGSTRLIQRRAKEYMLLVLFLAMGALCVSPEIIKLLGSSNYWDAKYLTVPMVLDSYVMFVYAIIVQAEYYCQKTQFVLLGTIVAAVINIITNVIFISMYGYVAAAYTTLFSYICYLVLHVIIAKKSIGFHIVLIRQHIEQALLLIGISIVCLLSIDRWLIRWGTMIIGCLLVFIYIYRLLIEDGNPDLKSLITGIIKAK